MDLGQQQKLSKSVVIFMLTDFTNYDSFINGQESTFVAANGQA